MAEQDLSLGVLQIFNNDIGELNNIFARIQALIDDLTRITLSIVSDIPVNQVTHFIGGTPAETGASISLYSPDHPTLFYSAEYRAIQHTFRSADNLTTFLTIDNFLRVPVMTTVERDALTPPSDGVFFYNSTLGKYQGREGGAYKTFTTT
jgi:hypothetical protein